MGKLSERLQSVAALVSRDSVLADVGCDHGYLPIYLVETGQIPRAIAMDVNPGPLNHAAEHIRDTGLEAYIETRLSDGLRELRQGEADSLVIAGMGGALTIRILSDSYEVWQSLREVILQPQSEIEAVRRYIYAHRFHIVQEDMVEEDGKYYMMMRCVPGEDVRGMTEADYRYGRCLIQERHPVLLRYLRKSSQHLEGIRRKLQKQVQTEAIRLRTEEVTAKLAVLSSALEEMEA